MDKHIDKDTYMFCMLSQVSANSYNALDSAVPVQYIELTNYLQWPTCCENALQSQFKT